MEIRFLIGILKMAKPKLDKVEQMLLKEIYRVESTTAVTIDEKLKLIYDWDWFRNKLREYREIKSDIEVMLVFMGKERIRNEIQ